MGGGGWEDMGEQEREQKTKTVASSAFKNGMGVKTSFFRRIHSQFPAKCLSLAKQALVHFLLLP